MGSDIVSMYVLAYLFNLFTVVGIVTISSVFCILGEFAVEFSLIEFAAATAPASGC